MAGTPIHGFDSRWRYKNSYFISGSHAIPSNGFLRASKPTARGDHGALMSVVGDAEIRMAESRLSGVRQERRNLDPRVRFPSLQCFARARCSFLLRGAKSGERIPCVFRRLRSPDLFSRLPRHARATARPSRNGVAAVNVRNAVPMSRRYPRDPDRCRCGVVRCRRNPRACRVGP